MKKYKYLTLRQQPELKNQATEWFYSKWSVPKEAYFDREQNMAENIYVWFKLIINPR